MRMVQTMKKRKDSSLSMKDHILTQNSQNIEILVEDPLMIR
jgi:hypothetical protein